MSSSISIRNIALFTSLILFFVSVLTYGMDHSLSKVFVHGSLAAVFFCMWSNLRAHQKELNDPMSFKSKNPSSKTIDHAEQREEMFGLIRVFASPDDAQKHGWAFEDEIGSYQGTPLYRFASLGGKKWEYQGLAANVFSPMISDTVRMFGQLQYKKIEDPPQTTLALS